MSVTIITGRECLALFANDVSPTAAAAKRAQETKQKRKNNISQDVRECSQDIQRILIRFLKRTPKCIA